MKISGLQKIKTGLFILIAFLVLVLIIFFIGKQKNLFSATFLAYANFKNVSGLQIGNAVRFGGINVGTVNNISIVNDTTIRVDMVLQKKVSPFVRADSKASIGSQGLMGDKLIQISPGSKNAGPLINGHITGVDPTDMDEIMGRIDSISVNAEVITENLASIFYKMNNGKGSLGELLNNDQLGKNIESTVKSANKTVSNINKVAKGLNQNLTAAKHSFLLRGYFRKKAKKIRKDSIKNAQTIKRDSIQSKDKGK